MARKKDNKAALFEVLSENRRSSMKLPDWAKPNRPQPVDENQPQETQQQEQVEQAADVEPQLDEQQNIEEKIEKVQPVRVTPEPQVEQDIVEDVETPAEPVADEIEDQQDNYIEAQEDSAPVELEEKIEPRQQDQPEEIQAVQPAAGEQAGALFTSSSQDEPEQQEPEPPADVEDIDEVQDEQVNSDTDEDQPAREETPQPQAAGYSWTTTKPTVEADEPQQDDIEDEMPEYHDEPQEIQTAVALPADQPTFDTHDVADQAPPEPEIQAKPHHKSYAETWPVKPQLMRADGDYLHITLSRKALLISLSSVAVAIILIFCFGRLSVSTPTAGETEVATDQAPANAAGTDAAKADAPAQTAVEDIAISQPGQGQRDPKRYYLVLQQLPGADPEDHSEAFRIVDFCNANGWPAEVVKIGNKYAVWSLKGLTSPRTAFAKQHALEAENLGKKYFKEYRTYDFRQRKRDGKLTPFFMAGSTY